MSDPATTDRIIRKPEVVALVGLSDRSIDRREASGEFPRRLRLGPGTVGWRLSAIRAWIDSRPTAQQAKEGE